MPLRRRHFCFFQQDRAMHSLVYGLDESPVARPRTIIAAQGKIWLWPGVALTSKRGDRIVTASAETIRFWITRLHGPDALHAEVVHCVARAADCLTRGDEKAAQRVLDAIGLSRLSPDGAVLMHGVAKRMGVEAIDLPLRPGLRCSSAGDIATQVAFFEKVFDPTAPLAKFAAFDPLKHPRWPAGAPESQGGRFAPANGENAQIVDVQYRGHFHDQMVDYFVNLQRINGGVAVKSVPLITVSGQFCIADALLKPPGAPPFILEVKTGKDPQFTLQQALVYPWAVIGNHVTSFKPDVTQIGLAPGLPFPSMNIVVISVPGPGETFHGHQIIPKNLPDFMREWFQKTGRYHSRFRLAGNIPIL
jgi:hypothetical protein